MISREFYNAYLHKGSLLSTFAFFALALFCVSLTLGPNETLLRQCAPGLIWILAILTIFFSTPLLLKREAQCGLLDEILLHPSLTSTYLLSKIMAEFLFIGLPLALMSFLLSPLFALSSGEMLSLLLTLLIGFPALSALGILGSFLTLNTQGGSLLLSLIILPLTLPLLIFGLSVMEMTRLGLDSFPSFCLLMGSSLFLLILSVTAGSWALPFVAER
ncbi:MAG: heme exporter protein CcmB [Alphaproteobacteria bacterium]|nr:heme exporter protein CcmB [Alphaproteobacteria bacterium]